jgi:uncharacterized protein YyaL (SSP411 family)
VNKSDKAQRNRLAQEKSPYLLQHAENPVDWYAWGEEAFAKARSDGKPIFLSIGYSTCHWCHVMAHESFENEETAALMNRDFVNIKVDREERPDIDCVYMTFVQAMTGHGGWPMSVWLTPDLQPFVGGTYFPPADRYGHPGFPKVLGGIAAAWKENRDKIVEQGAKIVEVLQESQGAQTNEGAGSVGIQVLDKAFDQLSRNFDGQDGGFGDAPKFPRPVSLNFLTRYYVRKKRGIGFEPMKPVEHRQDGDATRPAQRALDMHLFTLRKMAAGGMHDHLGGGFHRYSVDRYWHVPHFEKMLYDQAQVAVAYLEAFQITRDNDFAAVTRDILDYVLRDMTSPEGGFYSAEDADSPIPVAAVGDPGLKSSGATAPRAAHKTAEGAFYVWSEEEIDQALDGDSPAFKFHYGVQPHGNAPEGSDPQNEFRGKNILIERHNPAETAERFGLTIEALKEKLRACRQRLFEIRNKRPRPHLDDKIICAWNGLMISAFARAGAALQDEAYIAAAVRSARFVEANLSDRSRKILFRSFRQGRSDIEGFADDYAFVIQAMVDLYEATFDVHWLKSAVELQESMDELFWDNERAGYFSTTGRDASVVLRMKDDNDSAEPAASSVAALNLLRLAQMRGRNDWRERGERTIQSFAATLEAVPSAMPQMLVAFVFADAGAKQIVIAGDRTNDKTKALLRTVHQHFAPDKILLLSDGAESGEYLAERLSAIAEMKAGEGQAAAYVCENFTCQAPVSEPGRLADLLG